MNAASNAAPSRRHPSGRYPLLWASFTFSAGIIFSHYAWRPPLWWVVAWLVCAFSAAYLLRRRATAPFGLALAALFSLGALVVQLTSHPNLRRSAAPQVRDGVREVTAIDVALAILFCWSLLKVARCSWTPEACPIGLTQLDIGEDVVSPYLWARGFARLDAVGITHGHSDHIGGMPAVIKNFSRKELWLGADSIDPDLERLAADAQQLGLKMVHFRVGNTLEFGRMNVRILAPYSQALEPAETITSKQTQRNSPSSASLCSSHKQIC